MIFWTIFKIAIIVANLYCFATNASADIRLYNEYKNSGEKIDMFSHKTVLFLITTILSVFFAIAIKV